MLGEDYDDSSTGPVEVATPEGDVPFQILKLELDHMPSFSAYTGRSVDRLEDTETSSQKALSRTLPGRQPKDSPFQAAPCAPRREFAHLDDRFSLGCTRRIDIGDVFRTSSVRIRVG